MRTVTSRSCLLRLLSLLFFEQELVDGGEVVTGPLGVAQHPAQWNNTNQSLMVHVHVPDSPVTYMIVETSH